MRITVGVLTFRRPEVLGIGLPAILEQVREVAEAGGHKVELLVVDNDPDASARPVVEQFLSGDVRYVVEPRPGVSAARNRALDEAASSDLLAFIDDDEWPQSGWLANLVTTYVTYQPAAVAGRVITEFMGPVDPWIAAGKFFFRRSRPTGSVVKAAGAGNLMVNVAKIAALGLRFDDAFGLSGGEDTVLTRAISRSDRIVWCDEAVVADRVPVDRITKTWVLTRAFSHGNSAGLVEILEDPRMLQRVGTAWWGMVRVVGGTARYVTGLLVRSNFHQACGLQTACKGAGMTFAAAGMVYDEYARSEQRVRRRVRRFVHSQGTGRLESSELVVLLSFPATPPKGNPFRLLLERSLRHTDGLHVLNFSWRTALTARYDVFHVHWPEILVSGQSPVKKVVRQAMFLALLARLRLTRRPIVRTVHNLELPRGISRRERWLLQLADRMTTLRIRINDSTVIPPQQLQATILHGHYREWFASYPTAEVRPSTAAFFGLIRTYKGVDHLITAFRETGTEAPEARLVILGSPSRRELAERLRSLAVGDDRIDLRLGFISDADLVLAVTAAELIVLPYREMHNSAGVLTALSLNRPVLVPDNEVNRRLAVEVGPGWVYRYDGILTGAQILTVMAQVAAQPPGRTPDLGQREWDHVGQDHLAAYRRAAAALSRRS